MAVLGIFQRESVSPLLARPLHKVIQGNPANSNLVVFLQSFCVLDRNRDHVAPVLAVETKSLVPDGVECILDFRLLGLILGLPLQSGNIGGNTNHPLVTPIGDAAPICGQLATGRDQIYSCVHGGYAGSSHLHRKDDHHGEGA